jgi:predicted nucleic acid-binding protein
VHGYLLDTNIIAYWFDPKRPQHERVMQRIQELPQATPLMISAINLGEIEYGLSVVSENCPAEQQALRVFVDHHLPMVLEV